MVGHRRTCSLSLGVLRITGLDLILVAARSGTCGMHTRQPMSLVGVLTAPDSTAESC